MLSCFKLGYEQNQLSRRCRSIKSAKPQAAKAKVSSSMQLLLADPQRFLTLAGSSDTYISLLRQISSHFATFPNALKKKATQVPFLLGFERVGADNAVASKENGVDDEDEGILRYRLATASEVSMSGQKTASTEAHTPLSACCHRRHNAHARLFFAHHLCTSR